MGDTLTLALGPAAMNLEAFHSLKPTLQGAYQILAALSRPSQVLSVGRILFGTAVLQMFDVDAIKFWKRKEYHHNTVRKSGPTAAAPETVANTFGPFPDTQPQGLALAQAPSFCAWAQSGLSLNVP